MALLDSPDQFLNTGRPPHEKHYRWRNHKERERTRQYTNQLIITIRCQHCRQSFTGRLEDGRHWFTNHTCQRG